MRQDFASLGCGIGFRNELKPLLLKHKECFDFVEIYPESFMPSLGADRAQIELLGCIADEFKVVVHSVNLSIATEKVNVDYIKEIKLVCDKVNAPYYSDHLSITQVSNVSVGQLTPIHYNEQTLKRVVANINFVQNYLERPFLIENIAYHYMLNDDFLQEVDFINAVVNETNCGILLDLANLHANSINYNFNPFIYLDQLDKQHIAQIHLAGGVYDSSGYLYDSHNNVVETETWRLLNYILKKSFVNNIILEYDQEFPDYKDILMQLDFSRAIMRTSKKIKELIS